MSTVAAELSIGNEFKFLIEITREKKIKKFSDIKIKYLWPTLLPFYAVYLYVKFFV